MRVHLIRLLVVVYIIAASVESQAAPWGTQQPDPDDAARLEREAAERQAEAERLRAEAEVERQAIERLQYDLVAAARARGDNEREALAAEARLSDLAVEETELLAQVEADRDATADVFAALARIERGRPPSIMAHGDNTLDAARAAALLAEVVPALDARAKAALDRLVALQELRARIADQQTALGDAETRLALRRTEIMDLIAERTDRLAATRALADLRAAESARLAARAASLRELIAALEERASAFAPRVRPVRPGPGVEPTPRLKPAPDAIGVVVAPYTPPTGRFADARGALSLPVEGQIVSRFGAAREDGLDEGLVIRGRREGQVTSPFDARIEYAGPFQSYGQLMILAVGDGYHIVLAGLSSISGVQGQTVLAGETIGELSPVGRPPPELYLEIRKDGEPIDPAPWLRGG